MNSEFAAFLPLLLPVRDSPNSTLRRLSNVLVEECIAGGHLLEPGLAQLLDNVLELVGIHLFHRITVAVEPAQALYCGMNVHSKVHRSTARRKCEETGNGRKYLYFIE